MQKNTTFDTTPVETFEEARLWLKQHSTSMIHASRRQMNDGTAAFPPQVGCGYEAFWLRDYLYMLEGNVEAFTDEELEAACRLFVAAQREDGAMVDCVKFDGTPIYKPGYGTMGENPVADGAQFAVAVVWHTFQRTQNLGLLSEIVDRLAIAMSSLPRTAESGLIFIDPDREWDRCPYGFTDTILKTGEELFCSLLFVQACQQLSQLFAEVENHSASKRWSEEADRVTQNIRTTFWNQELGLFQAATVQCAQPDIWGSAFAAYIGVATPSQTLVIANYFLAHYADIVLHGQIRHLPGGMYWEKTQTPRDTYQNGAFWGTPTGWFIWVLRHIDAELADRTLVDLVRDFQKYGVYEWIYEQGAKRESKVHDYLASVALPLAALSDWRWH